MAFEVVQPYPPLPRVQDCQSQLAAVGRCVHLPHIRAPICRIRHRQWHDPPRSVDHHQLRWRKWNRRTPQPGQRPVRGDRELARAVDIIGVPREQRLCHRTEQRYLRPANFQALGVERDGVQSASAEEHEMPRRKVARVGRIREQDLRLSAGKRQRHDFLVAPRPVAFAHRVEQCPAAGQGPRHALSEAVPCGRQADRRPLHRELPDLRLVGHEGGIEQLTAVAPGHALRGKSKSGHNLLWRPSGEPNLPD